MADSSRVLEYPLNAVMSFPTPSLAHLKKTDYDNIYEPAEDTFLMMDALEKDAEFLKEQRYYISIFDPSCILSQAGFNFCGVGCVCRSW